ncbi:MAG TPA: zinc ribbon domain-containing protein [Thermoplasmata archaeon]|nr:zinc ribbon domain-containing protein [Thermoplasmata archaeon]
MQPPMYGAAPVPYLPAVLVNPETVQGIRTYKISLVLDIIFGAFALAIALPSILIATVDLATALVVGATLGAATCGLILVFVINFMVSLSSVLKMHHGRNEYGMEHARFAGYGVIFKWLGTTMSVTAAVLVVYLLVLGSSSFFLTGQVPPTVYVPILITGFWTAGVSFKGQMYRYFVRALQAPEMRRRTDIASFLIPILGVAGIGIVGWLTIRVVEVLSGPFVVDPLEASRLFQMIVGAVFLPPGLAVIGYVVLLLVYGKTSDRLMDGLNGLHASIAPPPGWPGQAPPPWVPRGPPPTAPAAAWSTAPSSVAGPGDAVPPAAASEPASPGFCPGCGKPLGPGAAFCMYCGTRIPKVA